MSLNSNTNHFTVFVCISQCMYTITVLSFSTHEQWVTEIQDSLYIICWVFALERTPDWNKQVLVNMSITAWQKESTELYLTSLWSFRSMGNCSGFSSLTDFPFCSSRLWGLLKQESVSWDHVYCRLNNKSRCLQMISFEQRYTTSQCTKIFFLKAHMVTQIPDTTCQNKAPPL